MMDNCFSLYNHIKNGKINDAEKCAQELSRSKTLFKIISDDLVPIDEKWNPEYCDLIKVTVQDSEEETYINCYISRLVTIKELKQKVKF